MSTDPKTFHNRAMSMGTGVFLLVFSVVVVVLNSSNFLVFGLAFFVLMIGIMLVMVGAITDTADRKKAQPETRTETVREIVKVRCKYCGSLNLETSQCCTNCGGRL